MRLKMMVKVVTATMVVLSATAAGLSTPAYAGSDGPNVYAASGNGRSPAGATISFGDDTAVESAVVARVMSAQDPKAAYEALSVEERQEFDGFMLTAEFDLASSTEPADREAQGQPNLGKVPNGMVGSDDAMASSRGCWDTKATGYAKNQMGNTLYTFWTVLNWCSNGNKVTSAKIVEADGETSTPGWRYEGVKAKAAKVMNDFYARGYSKHLFILGIGGWDVQNMNACIRTFGYRDGSPGISDYVCSLY